MSAGPRKQREAGLLRETPPRNEVSRLKRKRRALRAFRSIDVCLARSLVLSLSLSSRTHVITPPPPRSKIEPSRRGSMRRGRTSGGGGGAAAAAAEALDAGRSAIGFDERKRIPLVALSLLLFFVRFRARSGSVAERGERRHGRVRV